MRGTRVYVTFCTLLLFCESVLAQSLPFRNPLTATIPKTSWSIELQDVLTIPNSSGQKPRLEFLTGGGAPNMAYVIDQRGEIYEFDVTAGSPTPSVFLDLSAEVPAFRDGSQEGVRGLAFHPDFNNVGTDGYPQVLYFAQPHGLWWPLGGQPDNLRGTGLGQSRFDGRGVDGRPQRPS